MTSAEISALVDRVAKVATPSNGDVTRAIGIPLHHSESAADMDYFVGAFQSGPLDSADLRINHATKLGILVLNARPSDPTPRTKIATASYGAPTVNVNPHIPPEGVTSYTFQLKTLAVTFQFTTKTEILRVVSFQWPERAK